MSTTTKPKVDYKQALHQEVKKQFKKKAEQRANILRARSEGMLIGGAGNLAEKSVDRTADAIQRAAERYEARRRIKNEILAKKRQTRPSPPQPEDSTSPLPPPPSPGEGDNTPTDTGAIDYNDLGDYGWTPEDEEKYQAAYDQFKEEQENESIEDLRARRKLRYRAAVWGAKYYAKSKAQKAVRKELTKMAARRAAAAAARQTAQAGARAGVTAAAGSGAAAGGGAIAGASAAPTGGMSILIYIAAMIIVWGAIQAAKFIRHPVRESQKWGKRLGVIVAIAVAVVMVSFIWISFLVIILDSEAQMELASQATTTNTLFITKTANSDSIPNITYTINVRNEDQFSDVTVVDEIPEDTQFLGAEGDVTLECEPAPCGPETRKITWRSKDNKFTPPINTSFKFTVRTLVSDAYIVNIARGELSGGAGERGAPTCTGYQCALEYIVTNSGISSNFRTPERPSHNGIDIIAESRIPIYALEEGSVSSSINSCSPNSGNLNSNDPQGGGCGGGAGNYVFIRTANKGTYKYMHMEKTTVGNNEIVVRGQVIGYVDHTGHSSGTHLHFQIDNPGPVNPANALANWPN